MARALNFVKQNTQDHHGNNKNSLRFYFEIITDSQQVAKTVQKGPRFT